jgi:hypothetical protein
MNKLWKEIDKIVSGKEKPEEVAGKAVGTWLATGDNFWRYGCGSMGLVGVLLLVSGLMSRTAGASSVGLGLELILIAIATFFGVKYFRILRNRGIMTTGRFLLFFGSLYILAYFFKYFFTGDVESTLLTILFGGPVVYYTYMTLLKAIRESSQQDDLASRYGLYMGKVTHEVVNEPTDEDS